MATAGTAAAPLPHRSLPRRDADSSGVRIPLLASTVALVSESHGLIVDPIMGVVDRNAATGRVRYLPA